MPADAVELCEVFGTACDVSIEASSSLPSDETTPLTPELDGDLSDSEDDEVEAVGE